MEITLEDWRAQVEKELGGTPFEKALVHTTPEGLAIQPLYVQAPGPTNPPGVAPFVRGASADPAPFGVCMRHTIPDAGRLVEDLRNGADAVWLDARDAPEALGDALAAAFSEAAPVSRAGAPRVRLVLEAEDPGAASSALLAAAPSPDVTFVLAADPLARYARGRLATDQVASAVSAMAVQAASLARSHPGARGVGISTTAYHDAGADAAEEIALALSTGVVYLEALLAAGLDVVAAARQIAVRVTVGRDTFVELAKLRALRVTWHKLLAASGAPREPLSLLHAVASARTMSRRDPWVNMLRVTTQIFAAVLGGADLVTPRAFDEAPGGADPAGGPGHRVARNAGLILREESHLGRVVDPAGGSFYLETLTDQLAREAWRRFQSIERSGGITRQLRDGTLGGRLEQAWSRRVEAFAKRKEAIVGLSEFANLDEAPASRGAEDRCAAGTTVIAGFLEPLPVRRDAEAFEDLRDRADGLAWNGRLPTVTLVTLGPPGEHRARVGFASAFFAVGGLRTHATDVLPEGAAVVCLCGSDERYAAEAAATAVCLRAAGTRRILLAGRPGALETALREAGVDGFLFMGCDATQVLGALLEGLA